MKKEESFFGYRPTKDTVKNENELVEAMVKQQEKNGDEQLDRYFVESEKNKNNILSFLHSLAQNLQGSIFYKNFKKLTL